MLLLNCTKILQSVLRSSIRHLFPAWLFSSFCSSGLAWKKVEKMLFTSEDIPYIWSSPGSYASCHPIDYGFQTVALNCLLQKRSNDSPTDGAQIPSRCIGHFKRTFPKWMMPLLITCKTCLVPLWLKPWFENSSCAWLWISMGLYYRQKAIPKGYCCWFQQSWERRQEQLSSILHHCPDLIV